MRRLRRLQLGIGDIELLINNDKNIENSLPEGTKVKRIFIKDNYLEYHNLRPVLSVIIEHESFSEVQEGTLIPEEYLVWKKIK